MAHAKGDQSGVVFVLPTQQFVGLTAVNAGALPSHHPNPPVNSSPFRPPVAVIRPCYVPAMRPSVRFGINPAVLFQLEVERSMSLLKFIADEGLIPSAEEEMKRKAVIDQLKRIVMQWVEKVAFRRQLPECYAWAVSASILTYGSYGLGVHNSESDIDALCVGPCFATMAEDFFIVLYQILASLPEVSEIHRVKDAKVPLMRFKFNGILIDLPYAQLEVMSVPENVDILNPFFLKNVNETSWKSLSGVRANKSILQLVPNLEMYQSMLRCVKLWAKRRGIYGNLFGFFGGVHLAILVAFICRRYPGGTLSALISIFFRTFAFWSWPRPVSLLDGIAPSIFPTNKRSSIPIQLPCSPFEYCHSNITRSTFHRIRSEFRRGYILTRDMLQPDFDWALLFESFPYSEKYAHFVKIRLSASNQDELGHWVGWIKSRFRCLVVKLEELHGFCDPNPTECVDGTVMEPNVVYYWGLQPSRCTIDISSVEKAFNKSLVSNACQGCRGSISLSIVNSSQIPNKC